MRTRQQLLSTLARSSLQDILHYCDQELLQAKHETLRPAQSGMVMAVARAGGNGEPFNLGEVSVSRCAVRLDSGETGVGYVRGRNLKHAQTIALLDALAQNELFRDQIQRDIIAPLEGELAARHQRQQQQTEQTRVEFFTMVRGETSE